ncbi:g246 [Yersinia phage phiR1-37]|uniref:hypothetical protein n=1 Tax=Yersinia phage phiR1-37 TaxID=331278 RepID=UPI00022DBDA1|nr:hypothetical protein phiR1-37_gp246 [Yersinia phage phiR1-37]CCE26269.1 g246 [Yersinia phage phiR1-37]
MVSRLMQYGYETSKVYFLLPKNAKNEKLYDDVNVEMFKEPFLVLENIKTDLVDARNRKLHAPKKIQFNRNGVLVDVEVSCPEAYIHGAPLEVVGSKCLGKHNPSSFKKGRTYKSYWDHTEEYLRTIGSFDANQKCCAFRNFIQHYGNYFTVLKVDNIGIVEAIGSQGRIYTRPDASAFVYHSSAWFFTEI